MSRPWIACAAATVAAMGLVAEPSAAATVSCIPLTAEQYDSLELQGGPDITGGAAVEVPAKNRVSARWPTHVIALRTADSTNAAVLAVGGIDPRIDGPLDSLNQAALTATEFGAANAAGQSCNEGPQEALEATPGIAGQEVPRRGCSG